VVVGVGEQQGVLEAGVGDLVAVDRSRSCRHPVIDCR
jgi:hypothetical protein